MTKTFLIAERPGGGRVRSARDVFDLARALRIMPRGRYFLVIVKVEGEKPNVRFTPHPYGVADVDNQGVVIEVFGAGFKTKRRIVAQRPAAAYFDEVLGL